MWPTLWSDTETQQLKNTSKEIFMDLKEELMGMTDHKDIVRFYEEKARQSTKPYFKSWTFAKQEDVRWMNAAGGAGSQNDRGPWRFDHIDDVDVLKGFHYEHDPSTPVLDHIERARVFGMFRYLMEYQRRSALRAQK